MHIEVREEKRHIAVTAMSFIRQQSRKKVSTLTAKKKTKNSVKLTWKKTTRADGYQIYHYNSTKKKWEKVTTIKKGTTVTYTNKKLKSKKTYQYKVRAYRQNGNTTAYGSYSDILKVRTK